MAGSGNCNDSCDYDPNDTGCYEINWITKCPTGCGNGTLEGSENCDDGNQESGDGCSSNCDIEFSYVCFDSLNLVKINSCVAGELSIMVVNATCGNGFWEGQEWCDSINTLIG